MSDTDAPTGPRWQTQAGIGVALLIVAGALWFDVRNLPVSPAVGVGPSAALKLVGAIVAVLGICHFVGAWRARRAGHANATDRGNRASLVIVLAALVGQIALLELGGGFILSSVWLFVFTARGYGQRIGPKSVAIGATLAAVVYLFFTKALSLGLPAGPLERLLG